MLQDLNQLAQRQLADYDRHEPGTVFGKGLSLSIEEAYRVQTLVADLRIERGEEVIGYKVGCTSPVIRKRLGAEHPVAGLVFDSECWRTGTTLPLSQFASLAIEGELGVRLANDLVSSNTSDSTIVNAIESVYPVIELHNLAFRGERPSPEELIANNAIHAGLIWNDKKSTPFNSDSATLRIVVDDVEMATATGQRLTETIVESLRWLTAELGRRDQHLRAGQFILCGSVPDLIEISSGCRINVSTDRFGDVECTIE